MALGVLSQPLYETLNYETFEVLIKNTIPKNKESDDAETRKMAVKALIQAVLTFGLNNLHSLLPTLVETFYACLNDYQLDRRGDVGSWVREAAMQALTQLLRAFIDSKNPDLLQRVGADQPQFYERYVCAVVQQLSEKIDKVREVAGQCLQEFFKYVTPHTICNFAEKDALTALFLQDEDESSNFDLSYLPWRSAEFVFTSLAPFFDSPTYSNAIFLGLLTSSGGLTESTLKASSGQLMAYLSAMGLDSENGLNNKKRFVKKLCGIF